MNFSYFYFLFFFHELSTEVLRKKAYLMNRHFIKINMCISSVLCQSCYITVKTRRGGKVKSGQVPLNIELVVGQFDDWTIDGFQVSRTRHQWVYWQVWKQLTFDNIYPAMSRCHQLLELNLLELQNKEQDVTLA